MYYVMDMQIIYFTIWPGVIILDNYNKMVAGIQRRLLKNIGKAWGYLPMIPMILGMPTNYASAVDLADVLIPGPAESGQNAGECW